MKRHRNTALLSAAVLALVVSTVASRGGGLYLNEFGTPSMGMSGAGAQALAEDASTAFHNPAGMTQVEGQQLMVVGGVLKLAFKVVLIPVSLAFGLLKVVLAIVAVALMFVFAPVLLVLALVAIPLLLIAGLFGVGWAIVT